MLEWKQKSGCLCIVKPPEPTSQMELELVGALGLPGTRAAIVLGIANEKAFSDWKVEMTVSEGGRRVNVTVHPPNSKPQQKEFYVGPSTAEANQQFESEVRRFFNSLIGLGAGEVLSEENTLNRLHV
ncbi:hypothetical protein C4571_02375 [Candidatus Parcubacteria bacterium]|nr:MAG: hypothetical protein C4571_02375 [Candidatus Parcubacteria bacterium]